MVHTAMKIISSSSAENRPEVISPAELKPIESVPDKIVPDLIAELQALQDKVEQVRSRLSEQLLQNTRQVAKMSEEISSLRDVLAELRFPKSEEPSAPSPKEPVSMTPTPHE